MRHRVLLAALLLPLGGCYLPPPGPPAYAPPGYGYPPPPIGYDPYGNVYPGYSYNDGSPTLFVDGAVVPLILFGGGWGYWDSRHEWHRAPDAVARHIEQQRASRGDFRPGGGGFAQPRPEGGRPPGGPPNGAPTLSRDSQPPRQGVVPAAASRPAPAAHEEHGRRTDCPPGQRC